MPVKISIPTLLQPLTHNQKLVQAKGKNITEIIHNMESQYPGIKERIMDSEKVHRFMNIYLNDNDIRFLENLDTQVSENDTITILPAVAGG